MNFKSSTALIAALVLPLSVMAQNVATVNGKPVPMSRVDALIKTATHGQQQDVPPEVKAQAKDQVVMREIFAQEAEKQGIPNTADYKNQLDLVRQTVLINTLFQNFIKSHPVSDTDAKAEYDKIKAEQSGLEYHARHILVDSEDDAKKLIGQIKAGAKFEDLAKQYSKDPGSAKNGGKLTISKGQTVPQFDKVAFTLKTGATSPPVHTRYGWHIIQALSAVKPASTTPLTSVKDNIQSTLLQQKKSNVMNAWLNQVKKDFEKKVVYAPGYVPAATTSATSTTG